MSKTKKSKPVRDSDIYVSLGLFFLMTFVYFYLLGNYVLFFQETQSLFVFSAEYLNNYLIRPGGPLEYAARFLTQFYAGRFSGSIIVSLVLTLPGIILFFVNRRLMSGNSLSPVLLMVPSFIMFLMQANYYHMMECNLGFLMILVFYLFSVSPTGKYHKIIVLCLFPLFYYLAGAYALIFVIMYLIHNLSVEKTGQNYFFPILLVIVAAVSVLVSWKLIFLQPFEHFVLSPLPVLENNTYKAAFVILTGCMVFYPLLPKVASSKKPLLQNGRIYSFISIIILFSVTAYLLSGIYNPQTSRVLELEKLVFSEKWDEAVMFHEKKPSRNLIGQYFYNIALSETDQLCERLFSGSQDFGAGSLVLPWGDAHLNRGAYFYYSIGLINEAHRWAYEEMVVYGYRPQNIEMLAKTSLINGDYRMTRKYINILKKTIYYRKWAKELEKLVDEPGLIRSHPELGSKLNILPGTNFFIQFNEPQNNLPYILEGQPDNRKAIEYYLAGLLLTKKVEIAVNNIRNMKGSGYTRIPRHLEEAALIYYNSTRVFPELGGLTINPETLARFDHYFAAFIEARKDPSSARQKMQEKFGNTFWYYFHFR